MVSTGLTDLTTRRVLDNGLTAIVRPQRGAPIGTFWVWYRVGGRNEVSGITGASHWAEHMQFKGTQKIGKGEIFRSISAAGGSLNGFTWIDYTAYLETLPIERIDLALEIEADRMANSRFDPEEVASERTVIISERQGNENHPTFLLGEEVGAAAFKAHPYGHGVIGHMSDLEQMTRDDLYRHYQTHYQPNNAVAVFVGDLDADAAMERIERAFGAMKAGPTIPAVRSQEPEQFGERRVTVRRPAPNRVLQIAHRSVEAASPDAPALIVLDAVLSGGKPMGFGGGAAMGRSSRLYRALVASGLASSAGSSFSLSIDPYLFGTSVTLRPESDPQRVEAVVIGELERLAQEPVGREEFLGVMKQIRAQFAYGQQSVSSKAYLLGALSMVAPERTPESLLHGILGVTAEDVQRAASTYLTEDRRTVGWLIPASSGQPVAGAIDGPAVQTAGYVPDAADVELDPAMPNVIESRLSNGARLLTLDSDSADEDGPVVVRIRIPGGSALDDGARGVARFTADMLTRGSGGRTLDDLAEELDGLGASITAGAARESIDIGATALKEDAERVVGLLAAALLTPDFPAEQMEIVRAQILSGLRQARNDTRSEAEHLMRSMLFPDGHPYRERVSGTDESVAAIRRDDLIAHHQRALRPSRAIVAVAGAMRHEEARDLLERSLGAWVGSSPPFDVSPAQRPLNSGREQASIPGKSQADIAIGDLSLARSDPDYYALNVGNLILGRLGLMGRIGESVRERQGLAYYAFSGLETGLAGGVWSARAGVNPANVERAIEMLLGEIRAYLDDGPTDREFADAIGNLTGSLPMALETVASVASVLIDIGFFDLGLNYLRRYRAIIRALTPAQVVEAMRRHVDPDRLAIAVVGPSAG